MLRRKITALFHPESFDLIIKILKPFIILSYYVFRIFPIKKNKIVFTNYYGKGYGDSGKYILEELLRRNIKLDIVWLINGPPDNSFPKEVRLVPYPSVRAVYEEVTAKVWVDNCRKSSVVRKRKGQYYIQTWHGGIGPKRIEKDALEILTKKYIADAKNDSKMVDVMISNSSFKTRDFSEAFWYEGEILECGSPRNDVFFEDNQSKIEGIRQQLKISGNQKIALYTPTFRDKKDSTSTYTIDFRACMDALSQRFGGEWLVLERLHPGIIRQAVNRTYDETIINASSYPDIQELMIIADVLITDYSSTMFDFVLTEKPVFLYASDIKEYMAGRNFRFDIRELPFPLAENNDELRQNIISFDEDKYREGISKLFKDFGMKETGKASRQIADRIIQVMS